MDSIETQNEAPEVETPSIFTLTSLIDSSAALEAAERLYASNLGGVRFFSELNRALPKARAQQTAQRLENVALAEEVGTGAIIEVSQHEPL